MKKNKKIIIIKASYQLKWFAFLKGLLQEHLAV